MNMLLTSARAEADHQQRYTLAYECMGESAESTMDTQRYSPEARRIAIGTLLVHAFTRKADRFVATGMDLVAPNDADLRTICDKCAHLVIWLDEGQHSSAEAIEVIQRRLPLFVRLVGPKEGITHALRRAEWLELNDLAALIARCVEGEEVFNRTTGTLKAA